MKTRFIRALCTALVCSVLLLSLLLVTAVYTGAFDDVLSALMGHNSNLELGSGMLGGMGFQPNSRPVDFSGNMKLPDWALKAAAGAALANTVSSGGNVSGDLKNSETDLSNELILKLNGNENKDRIYLKTASFGDYNGQGWDMAMPYDQVLGNDLYSAEYLRMYTTTEESLALKKKLEITPVFGKIYANPYYIAPGEGYYYQYSDIGAVGTSETGTPYITYYYDYQYDSQREETDFAVEYEKAYSEFVKEQYLTVDDETRAYLETFIAENELNKSNVAEYVSLCATYNLKYNDALDGEENIVIAFLDKYKEGVCRHYASAATLIYRTMGIPARYTVGYAPQLVEGETVEVYGSSAHAWVEIYIEGRGWEYVEVTGGGNGNVQQAKTPLALQPADIVVQYDNENNTSINAYDYWEGKEDQNIANFDKEITAVIKAEYKAYEIEKNVYNGYPIYRYRAKISGTLDRVGKLENGMQVIAEETVIEKLVFDPGTGEISLDEFGYPIYEDVTDKFEIKTFISDKDGEKSIMHLYWQKLSFTSAAYNAEVKELYYTKIYDGEALSLPKSIEYNGETIQNYRAYDYDVDGEMTELMFSGGVYVVSPEFSGEIYYITITPTTTETDAGRHAVGYKYKIKDSSGRDCTEEFLIDKRHGYLEIERRTVYFEATDVCISLSKLIDTYGGSYVYEGNASLQVVPATETTGLLAGHSFKPKYEGVAMARCEKAITEDDSNQMIKIIESNILIENNEINKNYNIIGRGEAYVYVDFES